MTSRVVSYLHRHALSTAAFVCSVLALAGSSYAAFNISGSQILNHTINPVKLNPKWADAYVVIGSYVGEDRDPAWWLHLKAHPDAEVLVGDDRGVDLGHLRVEYDL